MTSLPGQVARTRRFALGVPERFTVLPGGATVLFLRTRAGDDPEARLWALDVDSGAERLLSDLPIGAYGAAGGLVAVTTAGELWTVDVAGGPARRLPARGGAAGPRPDPTGRRIAYLSGGALRVIAADGTGDRAVAEPDGPDVAVTSFWWAPDGERLLVARADSSSVAVWHIPGEPPRAVRYGAAGAALPQVTLWIAGLDGSRARVRCDSAAYVPDAGWDAHGPYAVVQSRDQRVVRFLAIEADGRTRVSGEWRDDRWVQLVPGLPVRTRSGAIVAHADRRGTRHLTVGEVAVTPPGLQLRAVLGVDGDEVLFTASTEPAETHLWVHGDGLRRLSAAPGVHSGTGRDGTLVHVARGADRPGGRVTVRRAGRTVTVASAAERPVLDLRATRLLLGPRDLRAALYLPSWHRGGRLPVLLDPYGGAGRQRVTAELDWRCLVSQWFAEQGFAVLVVDGRGTPGRGPDWERAVHGDLFGPVLEDQVTAVREAARRHPYLDLRRVGIRGWSFGGSLAALAVLRRPDVFHAAAAGAGVTDQRLYHAEWRERFLGHPDEFPERYDAGSLLREAPALTRPLLLMHGLADEKVHVAHTLRLSHALLAAGRPHEVLLLPGVGHQAIGSPVTEALLRHQARFLLRHLGPDAAS